MNVFVFHFVFSSGEERTEEESRTRSRNFLCCAEGFMALLTPVNMLGKFLKVERGISPTIMQK